MRVVVLVIALCCFGQTSLGQKHPAYRLYNSKGKKVSFKKMIKKLGKADIVLFGESHNNPIAHWLQFETVKALDKDHDLSLGAEMLERDNEEDFQRYMNGQIDQQALDSLTRLWRNYKTDYKPVIDYAKSNGIKVSSTNIPRRYASLVYRQGFEALEELSAEEKSWIAPLPVKYDAELPGYQKMLGMMEGHGGENFPKAQAIKDATMGHFILKNFEEGKVFVHLNGSYHSDNHGTVKGEGIMWYLQQERPELNYINSTTVSQKEIDRLSEEHKGKADFVICVPENMTKTY